MIAVVRLCFALFIFALSLLAVVPAPTYNLWKASIAVTEWGHYLALIALLTLLPGWRRTKMGRVAAMIGSAAFLMALSPIVRAMPVARAVAAVLGAIDPTSSPGAPPLSKPLRLGLFFSKPASPEVQMKTMTYIARGETPLDVDVYRREGIRDAEPLVVNIHGGSWSGGSRRDLPALNNYLAARGYVVASPSYRLSPEFRHPAATEDVNAAIDYLKANARTLGIDSTQIALVGRSAGGQLALISGYAKNDSSIRGIVAFYAPTDQKWGWDNPSDPRVYDSFATLRSFLGGSPAENPEGYRTSSPMEYTGFHAMPTLLIHGSRDELVSVKQSARLDSVLSVSRVPHLFLELPWATHGCDYLFTGPCGQISTYAIERFLASVLK